MIPSPNEDRPSRLLLDRLHTGELTGDERARVEAYVATSDDARAYLASLDAARHEVAPLDLDALRRRPVAAAPTIPAPANNVRWWIPVLLAALLGVFALPLLIGTPQDPYTDVRPKGAATLVAFVPGDTSMVPYDGEPLGEGDELRFSVRPGDFRRVVVLSVDGNGTVTVFWPEEPATATLLTSRTESVLPGTITLDGAPGPEVFVAVFTGDKREAVDAVRREWQSGGAEGVVSWAHGRADADTVVVERR